MTEKPTTEKTASELPKPYNLKITDGREALANENLINQLQEAWAQAYRQSTEPAQSNNPKYADNKAGKQQRLDHIRKELAAKSAQLVVLTHNQDVVGFFWGLSVPDLEKINPEKTRQIKEIIEASETSADWHQPLNWNKTVYLSMMGVVHKRNGQRHTGKKFGQKLTQALLNIFSRKGYKHAVARTINIDVAWKSVYQPLGFVDCGTFTDSDTHSPRKIFTKII